ncbi:hypothetical protein [Zhihengliuella flava]|uniref:Uncharacterized protein n=1 Tax=Zhihengliuella flava TaxID=1285193 RepID=A0A931GM00_9MICC|nr:hypothetical protein [Zhihengliuella flava]MBG6084934.1 hypothetical protein [Zhihengliuella flava]
MNTQDWSALWAQLDTERPAGAVTLTAAPLDVEAPSALPGEYALFDAPFDEYEVAELTHFDRPIARGRVASAGAIAVIAPVTSVPGDQGTGADDDAAVDAAHVAAVVEHLAQTAHTEGADVLYAVAGPAQVEVLRGMGFADA